MDRRALLMRGARVSVVVLPLLLALLHAAGVAPLGWLDRLDAAIGDARLRATMPGTQDPRIVIVDIDEASLARVGRWPWSRDRLAALTDELFQRQQAAVVGFDLVFAEPERADALRELQALARSDAALAARLPALQAALDHDARFAAALAGRRAVLGYYFTSDRGGLRSGRLPAPVFDAAALAGRPIAFSTWSGYGANLPLLADAAPRAGFFNPLLDGDGVVRSVPLIAEFGDGSERRFHETLALAMYRAYLGGPAVVPGFPRETWLPSEYPGLDSIQLVQGAQRDAIPVDARGGVRVPYRGPGGPAGGSFAYVSAADLLNGRLAPGQLAGKLVLVGTTAPGLYDLRATPVAQVYPGVEVHASLLSGLLDGRVPVQPDWARGHELALLLLTAALLGALLPRQHALYAVLTFVAVVAAQVALNLWLYTAHRWALPLASVLLLAALVFVGSMSFGYLVEGRTRRQLAQLFGSYVPPELVEEMARDPQRYDMRAENRELSVMFCDMRNFTRVSESLSPEEVRELVNRFFSAMTRAIGHERGTLDKYIGDAVMAFWGAPVADPAHARHAVRAALAMSEAMVPLNHHLTGRGLPEVGLGIGINSGLVCVGDMGSNARRSYTVMGDAVNLASRIEALTRHYGVDILVGAATRQACDAQPAETAEFLWLEVDRVRVKGKRTDVTLFTPVRPDVANAPSFADETRLWRLARDAARAHHWDEALQALHALASRHAGSAYTALYRQFGERLQQYKNSPPAHDWDGVHDFDFK